MQFKSTTIAPAGRNKYGNYLSSGNITRSVVTTTYAGNGTTTTIADGQNPGEEEVKSFYCILLKNNVTFNAVDLVEGVYDSTSIVAYRGNDKGFTYVCDFDSVTATTGDDGVISGIEAPENMGIRGLVSGITVTIQNNGTTGTTLVFHADSTLTGNTGTISIPVNIYMRKDAIPEANNLLDWYDSAGDCETVWLDYVWNVNRNASSNYILDLSNQTAGVNCDSAGTLYVNSIATLQCTATTYYNGVVATGITYSASTQPAYAAIGYSIDENTGVMTFNSAGTIFYWTTLYPSLPIDIVAYKDGVAIGTKTMTISRNYPGADGTPAHTRYIVTDTNAIQFNPNTQVYSPSSAVGRVMLQIGDQLPVYDSATTIYQWYDDLETGKTSALGSITANTYDGVSSITFALMNGDGEYYEVEEVPVISAGVDGEVGESSWYLSLSNDNASINCDADGNILPGARKPSCTGKLYYGQTQNTGATYSIIAPGATGVTGVESSGMLSIVFGDNFNFTGTTLAITVYALFGNVVRDTKTMNVTKSIAGENGEDAVSYWIEPSFTEVIYNPNTNVPNPSLITCTAYKQIGQGAIETATDVTIKYKWQKRSDSSWTSESTLPSTGLSITSGNCVNYFRLRLTGYVSGTKVDQEDVEIIKDGENGAPGESGASAWHLSLSNDNASINADSDGNILPGAIRPSCKATLYEGKTKKTSGVSYNVDYGTASGITTGVSSGVLTLTFGSSFNFTGGTLAITITASTDSELRDVKIMNVTKAVAGEGGEDAITYWLEPSFNEVIYDPNTHTPNPDKITCSAYKQIGQQAAVPATDATLKYKMQRRSDGGFTSEYSLPSTGVSISSGNCETYSRLRLILYVGSAQYDQEDIDILKDGIDGTAGAQGRKGPAVRGPYDFATHSGSTRCWCSGESGGTCDECSNWIDVILKDGTYYYCNTTYYGPLAPWNTYKSKWTSGTTFDFVATNLLLANNAKINFLTGNEIYLLNSNNEVTAGMAGGNNVNFWAGDDAPSNAPFRVYNDGTMIATQGTFGPFTIGGDALGNGALVGSASTTDSGTKYDDKATLNPQYFMVQGSQTNTSSPSETYSNTVYIIPTMRDNYSDITNGVVSVDMVRANVPTNYVNDLAINTNGNIQCGRLETKRGNAVSSKAIDLEIIYTTSSSTLFNKSGNWYIDGKNTGIPYVQPLARFRREGNLWYYGSESLGIATTSSAPPFTSGGTIQGTNITHWTFEGMDLGIDSTVLTGIAYNSAYNAWCATSSTRTQSTGIEHSVSGYGAQNAIYINKEENYNLNIFGTPSIPGFNTSYNRGYYRELVCAPTSSSASGTIQWAMGSEGTASDISYYKSSSWITVSRSSSASLIFTIAITANSTGKARTGYVEFFTKRHFGARVVINQSA